MRTIYIFSSAAHESDLARVLLTRSLEDLPESDDSIKDALQAFPRPIFLNAVEEYRGKPGSGKSQRAMQKRSESNAAIAYSRVMVDENFSVSQLMRVLSNLEEDAATQSTHHFCLHLVLHDDIRVVKLSNMLMSMIQGILVSEGTGKMWLKPSHVHLTLQIELGDACKADSFALAPCNLFGELSDAVAPFQLDLVAAETSGALQPTTTEGKNQTADFMRKSISVASHCCLEFREGQREPFSGIRKGKFPSQIGDLSDSEIPRAIRDLCQHFGMCFPNEESSVQSQLELTDYRHMAQICRLLALRLELFCQLGEKKDAWKVQAITKECLASVLGLQHDASPASSHKLKNGLFRQPLAFCLLNVLPDVDGMDRRSVSEEYMFLNADECGNMTHAIAKCDETGRERERTIDFADSIEGQQTPLPYSDDWQAKLAKTIRPLSMKDEGTGFEIRLNNGRLRQPHQTMRRADFPIHVNLLGQPAFNNYVQHKCRLRQKLGIALDLPDTAEVRQIVEGRGFVLTADVVAKAVVLKHRMQLGMNVILQGHTGVGKTEIVELLQHFFLHGWWVLCTHCGPTALHSSKQQHHLNFKRNWSGKGQCMRACPTWCRVLQHSHRKMKLFPIGSLLCARCWGRCRASTRLCQLQCCWTMPQEMNQPSVFPIQSTSCWRQSLRGQHGLDRSPSAVKTTSGQSLQRRFSRSSSIQEFLLKLSRVWWQKPFMRLSFGSPVHKPQP